MLLDSVPKQVLIQGGYMAYPISGLPINLDDGMYPSPGKSPRPVIPVAKIFLSAELEIEFEGHPFVVGLFSFDQPVLTYESEREIRSYRYRGPWSPADEPHLRAFMDKRNVGRCGRYAKSKILATLPLSKGGVNSSGHVAVYNGDGEPVKLELVPATSWENNCYFLAIRGTTG
jgi:hypothetical protein